MTTERGANDWGADARSLYLVAMAVFVVTITIGILNGSDLVTFDRNQLLTHVHSGTIGWLTLTIIASSFLLFRASDRMLRLGLAVLVPIYVLAFYTGNFTFRAIGGTALLVAVAWLLVWLWRTYLAGERTLPRLTVTLGLTAFGYGAIIGVLMQIGFALGVSIIPGDAIGAHASAMTFGYLALVAMGLIEWRVRGTRDLPTLGLVQVGVLFLGGFAISIGLMTGTEQIAGALYLLAQLVAVVLFAIRVLPSAVRRSWLAPDGARHFGIASLWLVLALLLFMYVVFTFISNPEDPNALNLGVLLASDHAVYIGVITNVMLGLLTLLFMRNMVPDWVTQLIFWGVNLGLAVFVVGLVADVAEIKRIGAPVMGISLLIGLGYAASCAWGGKPDTAALEAGGSTVS
jgi:hypothetical protein